LILLGGILWFLGGLPVRVERGHFVFLVPFDIAIIIVGLLFALLPLLPYYVLSLFLPKSKKEEWYKRLQEMEDRGIGSLEAEEDLPAALQERDRYFNRRYYITLVALVLGAGLAFGIGLPSVIDRYVKETNFRQSSGRLVRIVHDTRLAFSSADVYRRQIEIATPHIEAFGSRETATADILAVLNRLFAEEIATPSDFQRSLSEVYEERVDSQARSATGALPPTALECPYSPSKESAATKVTLLTLLATLANEEGDQGRHLRPYIQARQLLVSGLEAAKDIKEPLPSLHNALGVSLTSILKKYSEYEALFESEGEVTDILRQDLGGSEPLSRIDLAQAASAQYKEAADEATSRYLKARYLNNSVDLSMLLIVDVHFRRVRFSPQNSSEVHFLEESVDPPPLHGDQWQPLRLPAILARLESNLREATDLAREPDFYFTRAQLYSVAGRLSQTYVFPTSRWSDPGVLYELALEDLSTALRLGMPSSLFAESRAEDFYLDWLWSQPGAQPRLLDLSDGRSALQ
jgi:hypothetical protein